MYNSHSKHSVTVHLQDGINMGQLASEFYGIRSKRAARGGRMPTTNG